MGRKSNAKKNRRTQAKEQVRWDDLVEMRDHTISHMVTSQKMIGELFTMYGTEGEHSKDVRESILGMMKTYQDVVPRIQNIMKRHCDEYKENEDGTVEVKFKKGVIKGDSDEFFTAIEIVNQYQELIDTIADITSVGYTDLFTKLKNIDPNINPDLVTDLDKEIITGRSGVMQEQIKLASIMPEVSGEMVKQMSEMMNGREDDQVENNTKGENNGNKE